MESALLVPADHPSGAGHFPGRPIVPGVVLLAEALAAIERDTGRAPEGWTLAAVKFLQPVAPGTALTLSHDATRGGVRFEIRAGDRVVAGGALAPRD